jgi:hypothetical protein
VEFNTDAVLAWLRSRVGAPNAETEEKGKAKQIEAEE